MKPWTVYVGMAMTAAGLVITIYLVLDAKAEKRQQEFRDLRDRVLVIETKSSYVHGEIVVPSKGN